MEVTINNMERTFTQSELFLNPYIEDGLKDLFCGDYYRGRTALGLFESLGWGNTFVLEVDNKNATVKLISNNK